MASDAVDAAPGPLFVAGYISSPGLGAGGRTDKEEAVAACREALEENARERVCTCASIPSPRSQVAREPASRTRWRQARPLGLALVRETPHPEPAESREHRLDYLEGMDRLAKLGTTAPSRSRTQTCVSSIEISRPAKKSMSALLFQIPADSYRPERSSSRPLPNIEKLDFSRRSRFRRRRQPRGEILDWHVSTSTCPGVRTIGLGDLARENAISVSLDFSYLRVTAGWSRRTRSFSRIPV